MFIFNYGCPLRADLGPRSGPKQEAFFPIGDLSGKLRLKLLEFMPQTPGTGSFAGMRLVPIDPY